MKKYLVCVLLLSIFLSACSFGKSVKDSESKKEKSEGEVKKEEEAANLGEIITSNNDVVFDVENSTQSYYTIYLSKVQNETNVKVAEDKTMSGTYSEYKGKLKIPSDWDITNLDKDNDRVYDEDGNVQIDNYNVSFSIYDEDYTEATLDKFTKEFGEFTNTLSYNNIPINITTKDNIARFLASSDDYGILVTVEGNKEFTDESLKNIVDKIIVVF